MASILSYKGYQTLAKNVSDNSYACERCGHKEIIRYDRDRKLCSYCRHYIYKSKEIKEKYEFMEKMRGALKDARKK